MKSIKVLIADQHPVFREGLRRVLLNYGNAFVAGEASDCAELIKLIEADKIDILFLETRLPGENTVQLVETIHRQCPETEIYAMSSLDNFRYVNLMLSAGAAGYLSKNADNQETIRQIIENKSRWSVKKSPVLTRFPKYS